MQTDSLTLWTWQLPHWDITSEPLDPTRREEAWGADMAERLSPHYKRLCAELGTKDFVWCYTSFKHWAQLEVRRLWVLEVPDTLVFRFTDSAVWETIIGERTDDEQRREAWQSLFLTPAEAMPRIGNGTDRSVVPLLKVPICPDWVIDKSRFNRGPAAHARNLEDLPTSKEEALNLRPKWWREHL